MGCSSEKQVKTKQENKNQIKKEQNEEKNIELNKESEKAIKEKDEIENKSNEEVLYLKYETTSDNEEVRLFGNDVNEFDDYTIPFYEREHNKFDL